MAVAFKASSAGVSSSTTLSFSHTIAAGSNRLLLVGVVINGPSGVGGDVASIKYNGLSLTKISESVTGSSVSSEIWKLAYPPTGAHTVLITLGVSSREFSGLANSFDGCTGSVSGTVTTGSVAATSTSLTVVSAVNDMVVDFLGIRNVASATVGASQTARATSAASYTATSSTEAGAASVDMTWTWSGSEPMAHIATSIAAGTQPTTTSTSTSTSTSSTSSSTSTTSSTSSTSTSSTTTHTTTAPPYPVMQPSADIVRTTR